MPIPEMDQDQQNQRSDPRYVTIPFEYYRTLVDHFHSVMPSSHTDEAFESTNIDPSPISVGDTINLKGVDLFEEMPAGYRKLGSNGD